MKKHMRLTDEEAEILRDFDRGEFVSIEGFEEEKARFESAAREQLAIETCQLNHFEAD